MYVHVPPACMKGWLDGKEWVAREDGICPNDGFSCMDRLRPPSLCSVGSSNPSLLHTHRHAFGGSASGWGVIKEL